MVRARLSARLLRGATYVGSAAAVTGTVHLMANLRLVRRPRIDIEPIAEKVSVLLPVRDEAARVTPCLESLLAQEALPHLEILVLDDGSTDGTPDVVRAIADGDSRVRLIEGSPLPIGWLGKPHACAQLASAATGDVLVFVDADVVLAPLAIASTVALLRESDVQLVSPYPRQLADGLLPRLVQPLLQWSWLTFLPLRLAETSSRPSLVAANGQLMAVDASAYRAARGHSGRTVRGAVLEDIELMKALKRQGFRGGVADGTALADCRMYASGAELRDGYAKSLWTAFGSPAGASAVGAALVGAYVVPAAALLAKDRRTRTAGLVGTLAGVLGRVLAGLRMGSRVWPDALAHPVSVLAFVGLMADSLRRHRNGSLLWKGRQL